ncbi:hypothetical protein KC640_03445, partial [Candidatus Dojkabacteria bacterium]|nr:hypothetical protein [Candidatus Dojkabacteria bacterium]
MSKLKVLIVLIVIIGGVVYGVNSINQNLDLVQGVDTKLDDGVTADGVTWYQSTDKSFNIAVFEQPLFIDYTAENAQSLAEQSGLNKLVLAVNGGFFRGSYVDSEYAGLLQIKGEKLFPLVEFDDQLTHILVYDVQDDILAVEPAEGFDPENYG